MTFQLNQYEGKDSQSGEENMLVLKVCMPVLWAICVCFLMT